MRENKIRILHVAQAAGGVDCYIRMLLKYLDKEKFENIMVCSQDFRKEDYNRLADHFEQIEMTRAIGVNDLKVIKAVRKLIKKYNPDIVYAHSSKAGAVARVANIGIKNYCIYNPHGWAFNMKCSAKKKAMYTAIEKVAALFCDKIICISDAEEKSALEKKICREEKLQVILNGVDIEAYENGVHGTVTRRDLDIPKDAFVVGMVGRICPQKAPDIFVRMANQVRNKVPNAHFIIVGNGNQEAEIRKYAEKNGFSDSLHITGWVDNPMNYVELFDVACLLSRWEGFGLALPEYMMVGKPIVASRVDTLELQKEAEVIKDRIVFTGYIDYKDMPSIYQIGNVAVLPSMWEEPAGMTMVEAVVSGLPLITTNSGGIPEYIPDEFAYILDRNKELINNISRCILRIKNRTTDNAISNEEHRNKFIDQIGLEKYFEGFEYILKKG